MNWTFILDIAFYAVFGLLLAIPLVVLVAACTRTGFVESRTRVKEFLEKWAEFASTDFVDKIFKVAGISTVLFLLAFAAYTLNRFGDASLPKISATVNHMGSEKVRWSVENPNKEYRN